MSTAGVPQGQLGEQVGEGGEDREPLGPSGGEATQRTVGRGWGGR